MELTTFEVVGITPPTGIPADYGILDGLPGCLCFGYMMTFRNPVAEVFDLIPKCFCRLPPPN